MLTAAQCRAARGLLAWSQVKLANQARVGLSTLRDLETGRREISQDMQAALRGALEAAGVLFLDENGQGAGARLAKSSRRAKGQR